MEPKIVLGLIGTALGVGLVIGHDVAAARFNKKLGPQKDLAQLYVDLLEYAATNFGNEDVTPEEWEQTILEKKEFIDIVKDM